MSGTKDDILIQKLMEETYSFLPESESSKDSSDLRDYFNGRSFVEDSKTSFEQIKDLLTESGINELYEVEYESSLKCFRMKLHGETYDFPRNWGPFKALYSSLEKGESGFANLSSSDRDNDFISMLPIGSSSFNGAMIIQSMNTVLIAFHSFSTELPNEVREKVDGVLFGSEALAG